MGIPQVVYAVEDTSLDIYASYVAVIWNLRFPCNLRAQTALRK